MKKSAIYFFHLGYWLLYSFLVSFLFILSQTTQQSTFEDWDDRIALLLFTLMNGVLSFYAFYLWLVPRYLVSRQIKRFLGMGLLVSFVISIFSTLLVSLATMLIIYAALHQTQLILFEFKDQLILVAGFAMLSLVNGVMGTVIRGFITWYADIHLKELLAGKSLQTELELLKARLNPHFLFNTLNNVDILIEQDAPKASLYLNKLSDLLRFSLYDAQAEKTPLSRELDYINQYIDLQNIRTSNQQYVTMKLEGRTDDLLIEPMLFIPYIENAFKYAANKKVNGAIRIQILVEGAKIHFQCVNVIDRNKTMPANHTGLGQDLLRKRLALLYPENHILNIQSTDTMYSVDLTITLAAHALYVN